MAFEDYNSYEEYLKSAEWKELREDCLRRNNYRCEICGAKENLQAHHISYSQKDLMGRPILACLCRDCHEKVHRIVNWAGSEFDKIHGQQVEVFREEIYNRIKDFGEPLSLSVSPALADAMDKEWPNGFSSRKARAAGIVASTFSEQKRITWEHTLRFYFRPANCTEVCKLLKKRKKVRPK